MPTDLEEVKNTWNKCSRFLTHTDFHFLVPGTIYNHMTTIQSEELKLCTMATQKPDHWKPQHSRAVWSDGAMRHFAFWVVVKDYIDFHSKNERWPFKMPGIQAWKYGTGISSTHSVSCMTPETCGFNSLQTDCREAACPSIEPGSILFLFCRKEPLLWFAESSFFLMKKLIFLLLKRFQDLTRSLDKCKDDKIVPLNKAAECTWETSLLYIHASNSHYWWLSNISLQWKNSFQTF